VDVGYMYFLTTCHFKLRHLCGLINSSLSQSQDYVLGIQQVDLNRRRPKSKTRCQVTLYNGRQSWRRDGEK